MDARWIENRRYLARTLGRLMCGAGLLVGFLVLTAPAAHADDCATLNDCFYTAATAAQVAAALAIVLAAAVLALPALLRGAHGPAELTEARIDARIDAEGQGSGQGAGQGGGQGGQPQAQATGGTGGGGSNQGLNLPNLPDTPDIPLTPEVAGMMGAQEAEAQETERAREYTPQALDQMRALGLSAADVEALIQGGSASVGNEPGTTVYASRSGLHALVEATSGRVLDVRAQ